MAVNVEERIREIADRVAASHGLEIVDVEFRGGGGKSRILRVFIERSAATSATKLLETSGGLEQTRNDTGHAPSPIASEPTDTSGVTHEDCANFSREFGTILDVEDAVPGAQYTLEVSSPGLDRKLVKPRDYERFAGSRVRLTTREAIDGRRNFDGRLEGLHDGRIVLELPQPKKKKKPEPPPAEGRVEIALSNVEKANLVPEF
jgi:ribosome maturation factor RimP